MLWGRASACWRRHHPTSAGGDVFALYCDRPAGKLASVGHVGQKPQTESIAPSSSLGLVPWWAKTTLAPHCEDGGCIRPADATTSFSRW